MLQLMLYHHRVLEPSSKMFELWVFCRERKGKRNDEEQSLSTWHKNQSKVACSVAF